MRYDRDDSFLFDFLNQMEFHLVLRKSKRKLVATIISHSIFERKWKYSFLSVLYCRNENITTILWRLSVSWGPIQGPHQSLQYNGAVMFRGVSGTHSPIMLRGASRKFDVENSNNKRLQNDHTKFCQKKKQKLIFNLASFKFERNMNVG